MEIDLLHPDPKAQTRTHKLKRLVQSPNSYFMDVKCGKCMAVQTIFSHAQSAIICQGCDQILCQPTGGKCKLQAGVGWKRKPF